MANPEYFKDEFDKLAVNGCIGSPQGQLAFAYARVSDSDQAEDGRSGLPRQIAHIHEIALKCGYRIPWDCVFADDYTGFEFESRPALSRFRREMKSPQRRAHFVVMESLDRLSRNADWHQGYLLDEFKRHGISSVFWKTFSSRIERTVMGAIAQDGMEEAKARMMEGNLRKAQSGRVTARTPAYGYKLVDSKGKEGQNAKRETYYAIREDEAVIVRRIYDLVQRGVSMRQIASDLEAEGIKPPKQTKHWEATQLRIFIKNEIYRGDFYAHRWHHTTLQKPAKDGVSMQSVKCKVEYPREEWIHVPVPSLVSLDIWEAANRMLEQNKRMAKRNAREPYLLTGLVRCAYCGWKYTGLSKRMHKGKPRNNVYRGYRCPSSSVRPTYIGKEIQCHNNNITCSVLDDAVWHIVCKALLEPDVLLNALDADAASERNRQLEDQIAYLKRELTEKDDEDGKLYRAYLAGAYDDQEFAARRKLLKAEVATNTKEIEKLSAQVLSKAQLDQRKEGIIALSKQAREMNIPLDPPFELKRQIIKLVVDQITLNVTEGWFKLDGAIRGVFPIGNTPVGKGSCSPPKLYSRGMSPIRALG